MCVSKGLRHDPPHEQGGESVKKITGKENSLNPTILNMIWWNHGFDIVGPPSDSIMFILLDCNEKEMLIINS